MRNTYGVTVTVNGKPWRRVPNLTDAGARDRVFTVVRTDGGKTVVQFGDGVHGARPPLGSKIAVGYRTGAGSGGNTMTVVLQRTATPPTDDQALWVCDTKPDESDQLRGSRATEVEIKKNLRGGL